MTAVIFEDAIGRRVIKEVENSLISEIAVGEVSLSLIKSFPSISLDLHNVRIKGADNKPMLRVEHLRFQLGFFSLFSEKIDVESVLLENGALLLKVNKNGHANYDILKPTDSKTSSQVAFDIQKAILKNVTIGYENIPNAQDIGFTAQKAVFSGAFSSKQFELESNAEILSHGITIGKSTFLINNAISYTTAIKVNLETSTYQIKTFELGIEKNIFDVNGTIKKTKKATDFNLVFDSKHCDLSSILKLLPQNYKSKTDNFYSDGNIDTHATIKGLMTSTLNPAINATFSLKNGILSNKNTKEKLESVSFSGAFTNGAGHSESSTIFSIPNFEGVLANEPISMSLEVRNLAFPHLDFYLDSKIPLAMANGFFENNNLQAEGFLSLKNIKIDGYLADMKKSDELKNVKMSGQVVADKISFLLPKGKINIPQGDILFDGNTVLINNLVFDGFENTAILEGKASNFLPFFLDNSEKQTNKLDFDAKLIAKKIDFNQIFNQSTPNDNGKAKSAETKSITPFYKYLEGNFKAEIEEFEYKKINGKNFNGNIKFAENDIEIAGKADMMGGGIQLKGRVATLSSPDFHAVVICNKIDAKTFFYQCENFGQKVMTSENIKGVLDSKMVVDAQWDKFGNFLEKELVTYAYLNIQNGEVKNMKMLEDFSTFVKIEDLSHIKFTNLENWFEIRDASIYMPAMSIRNNALNMTVSGSHSFSNNINYNIKVNAAQVVVNRFKKFNPMLSPQKDIEDEGLFDLFFNMKGTLDKYEIEQAKTYVKAEFEKSQTQKRDIQTKLNAAVLGKDYQLQEKMLFKPAKNIVANNAVKKENKPKSFVLPKQYKPKKGDKDELGNELLEGF